MRICAYCTVQFKRYVCLCLLHTFCMREVPMYYVWAATWAILCPQGVHVPPLPSRRRGRLGLPRGTRVYGRGQSYQWAKYHHRPLCRHPPLYRPKAYVLEVFWARFGRHFGSARHGNADPPAAGAKACTVSTQGGAVCVRGFVLF